MIENSHHPMPKEESSPSLSVVLSCFNEAKTIEAWIRRWVTTLKSEASSFEILVLNDGSTDGTGRILDRLRRDLKNIRLIHQLQVGKGKSFRRGLEMARGKYVVNVCATDQYDPEDFLRMWALRETHSVVLGCRTHRLDSVMSRIFGHCLRHLIKALFGNTFSDPDFSFRLYRRDDIVSHFRRFPLSLQRPDLLLAILDNQENEHTTTEVPIPYRLNGQRDSRESLWAPLRCVYEVLWLWFNRPLFFPRRQALDFEKTT